MSRATDEFVQIIQRNNELKRENKKLTAENEKLRNEIFLLNFDLQVQKNRQEKAKGTPQVFGAYFYEAAKRVAHPEMQSE